MFKLVTHRSAIPVHCKTASFTRPARGPTSGPVWAKGLRVRTLGSAAGSRLGAVRSACGNKRPFYAAERSPSLSDAGPALIKPDESSVSPPEAPAAPRCCCRAPRKKMLCGGSSSVVSSHQVSGRTKIRRHSGGGRTV